MEDMLISTVSNSDVMSPLLQFIKEDGSLFVDLLLGYVLFSLKKSVDSLRGELHDLHLSSTPMREHRELARQVRNLSDRVHELLGREGNNHVTQIKD